MRRRWWGGVVKTAFILQPTFMGNAFSRKDVRLLIAGLDAAGKTSTPPCIDRARSLDRHSPGPSQQFF